jgi:hypothetical protein
MGIGKENYLPNAIDVVLYRWAGSKILCPVLARLPEVRR